VLKNSTEKNTDGTWGDGKRKLESIWQWKGDMGKRRKQLRHERYRKKVIKFQNVEEKKAGGQTQREEPEAFLCRTRVLKTAAIKTLHPIQVKKKKKKKKTGSTRHIR